MLASLSTGSQIPIRLRRSPTRCKHGLGIDPAQRPFHEEADPLQGNLVVAIDPATPVVPVHLDVGERGSSDGEAGGEDGSVRRPLGLEVASKSRGANEGTRTARGHDPGDGSQHIQHFRNGGRLAQSAGHRLHRIAQGAVAPPLFAKAAPRRKATEMKLPQRERRTRAKDKREGRNERSAHERGTSRDGTETRRDATENQDGWAMRNAGGEKRVADGLGSGAEGG